MKNKRGIVCVFILAGVLASAIVPGFAYQTEKSNRGAITDIVQTAGVCGDTEIGKTKGMGAEAAEAEAKAPDQAQIEGFSLIMQMPELPTGCEITALTMMLDHYGYAVDKTVMASEYLPVSPAGLYYGADGEYRDGTQKPGSSWTGVRMTTEPCSSDTVRKQLRSRIRSPGYANTTGNSSRRCSHPGEISA